MCLDTDTIFSVLKALLKCLTLFFYCSKTPELKIRPDYEQYSLKMLYVLWVVKSQGGISSRDCRLMG